jgi:hypothetical protein
VLDIALRNARAYIYGYSVSIPTALKSKRTPKWKAKKDVLGSYALPLNKRFCVFSCFQWLNLFCGFFTAFEIEHEEEDVQDY